MNEAIYQAAALVGRDVARRQLTEWYCPDHPRYRLSRSYRPTCNYPVADYRGPASGPFLHACNRPMRSEVVEREVHLLDGTVLVERFIIIEEES